MRKMFNMLITFFNLNAFFPLHLSETVVEYIYKINNMGVKLWQKLKV